MFYGQFTATCDSRGRFVLPKEIRQSLYDQKEVLFGHGPDGSLYGYDRLGFEEDMRDLLPKVFDEEGRRKQRQQFSAMQLVAIDELGRIVLPKRFIAFLGLLELPETLSIIGAFTHFEIWPAAAWETYAKDFD